VPAAADRGGVAISSFAREAAAFAARHGLIPDSARVLVALSGGPDSCALLLALCEAADAGLLARPVGAAHFHHGLRGADADADAAFSAALAARLGLPCIIGLGAAHPERGQSPNDAARRARYAFLAEAAGDLGADAIATAHTADDQAETVLLRVLRGTGTEGLAGMPARRDLGGGLTVVRPLLGQTRAAVEAYCAANGVIPRRDPSNEKDRYARSRLRKRLPELAVAFNPRLTDSLMRLADNAATDADLLRTLADGLWRDAVAMTAPGLVRLHTAPLVAAHPALRRRVLLRALRATTPAPEEAATSEFVAALEGILLTETGGLDLPGAASARRDGDTLTLAAPITGEPPASYSVPLALPGRTRVAPARLWLSARPCIPGEPSARARRATYIDLPAGALGGTPPRGTIPVGQTGATLSCLLVRDARPGDRMAPLGMGGRTRLVRDLMADAGWPEHLRPGAPLVARADTGEALWVVGLAQAEATRVAPDAANVWRLAAEWDC
jgi:tRNA(Ile)-lysidine synthase